MTLVNFDGHTLISSMIQSTFIDSLSVTDIADNIPLYLALLRLVQALAAIPDLVPLLNLNSQSISGALSRLYICLTEYKIYLP